MIHFLITCRIYGNSKLFLDVEVVFRWKDTSAHHSKTC